MQERKFPLMGKITWAKRNKKGGQFMSVKKVRSSKASAEKAA
jgi:hypothetical protein